ncbi:MAG: ATP-binding protein [Clostridia bacterium]|nr:ATP-binding protein [Clostridia bacterium]
MSEITWTQYRLLQEKGCRLIDLRTPGETAYGMLKGARRMAEEDLAALDPAVPVCLYCAHGEKSRAAAEALTSGGMEAYSLRGGWAEAILEDMRSRNPQETCERAEMSLRKRFRKTIWCNFTKAIRTYDLVKPGDCIAVCISGGKDSMVMAKLFQELKLHNKFPFDVKFMVMDPGYTPENRALIEENARHLGIPVQVFTSDIFDSVFDVEKNPCYLCARMRRGHLYKFAKSLGCNKIALGHHYDDVIETILMGMLYGGQMQTMMPKLHSTNFEGMELIRPMYLIRESEIKAWRDYNELHFLQCACKFTEAAVTGQDDHSLSKRAEIKGLIAEMKKVNPAVECNIFKSVENVCLDTVICYKEKGVKHHFLDTYDRKAPEEDA